MKKIMILALVLCTLLSGCSQNYEDDEVVKIGYIGDYEELPLFTAYESGYFEQEGLEVQLIPIQEGEEKESLEQGIIDALTCKEEFLKWNEEKNMIKAGAGITSSAVQIISSKYESLKELKDAESLRLGVPKLGGVEQLAVWKLFEEKGVDWFCSIEWVELEEEEIVKAVKNGEIDGGIFRFDAEFSVEDVNVVYQPQTSEKQNNTGHNHSGHSDEYIYINFAGISSSMADKAPEKSAALLRAWIQGANDVEEDLKKASEVALDKGYIDSKKRQNEIEKVQNLMWMPSVKTAKENISQYIEMQRSIGILESSSDEAFIKEVFAELLPFWD